jgi:hypothetical protein
VFLKFAKGAAMRMTSVAACSFLTYILITSKLDQPMEPSLAPPFDAR